MKVNALIKILQDIVSEDKASGERQVFVRIRDLGEDGNIYAAIGEGSENPNVILRNNKIVLSTDHEC